MCRAVARIMVLDIGTCMHLCSALSWGTEYRVRGTVQVGGDAKRCRKLALVGMARGVSTLGCALPHGRTLLASRGGVWPHPAAIQASNPENKKESAFKALDGTHSFGDTSFVILYQVVNELVLSQSIIQLSEEASSREKFSFPGSCSSVL